MGQKASILGPKAQSFNKLDQRRQEQEKVANASEVKIQKFHEDVQKELKQLSDANLKREQEHKEVINKLEEQEKENSSLVKGLRSNLEDARQKMATFDNKVHELETQVLEEQKASSSIKKRAEELEGEIKSVRKQLETEIDLQRVRKEFEDEKTAREEAWAKISALEQEINVAMRELDFERGRLKVATDKIMLVETHLREFHSTTEEMNDLLGKQQDQLKEMRKSLIEVEEEEEEKEEEISSDDDKKTDFGKEVIGTIEVDETKMTASTMEPSSGEREAQLPNSVEASSSDNVTTDKEEQVPKLVLQMTGISN